VFEELPALDEVPALDFGATVESAQEAPAMESEPEECRSRSMSLMP
jgi:chemosensory pili system protein ChpA (sensor histidine kinase/response regulator)